MQNDSDHVAGGKPVGAVASQLTGGVSDIETLKRLAEAATPGPWHWHSDPVKDDPLNRSRYEVVATGRTITRTYYTGDMAEREAAFIAAANPRTVLALIARIAELESGICPKS